MAFPEGPNDERGAKPGERDERGTEPGDRGTEPSDRGERGLGSAGDDDPIRGLRRLITGAWVAQAVYAAAVLGLADRLAAGPATTDELAAALGTHAPSLRRLLRALASLAVVRALDGERWQLTPLGAPLRADVPGSLRAYALLHGRQLWPLWPGLRDAVKTGLPPSARGSASFAFDRLGAKPGPASVFGGAMAGLTLAVADDLARALDVRGVRTLLDVGGGQGQLLSAVLVRHPSLRGILVDLPYVLDAARARLDAAGVGGRCDVVPGDFFEAIPVAADACLLKSVLHDWDDERCATILARCRGTLPAGGRLLVIEQIMPERVEATTSHRDVIASDLNMMVTTGGRERTLAELRALLTGAGFAFRRTTAAAGYDVVEAEAVAVP